MLLCHVLVPSSGAAGERPAPVGAATETNPSVPAARQMTSPGTGTGTSRTARTGTVVVHRDLDQVPSDRGATPTLDTGERPTSTLDR
ncbi:hypothetical protein GCM10009696_26360 [Kocuria himachalensis]